MRLRRDVRQALPRPHRAALLAAAVLALGACVNVLGLDEYDDAAHELCDACDGIPACEETLNAKLGAASAEEQKAWLTTYQDLDCSHASCKTTALQCFYGAPGNCAAKEAPCAQPEACCGFDFAKPRDGARCCVGGGEGSCCDTCRTCAELLGEGKIDPDLGDLCVTHQQTWDDLVACGTAKCSLSCAGGTVTCKACLNDPNKCKSFVTACNANQAP